MTHLRVGGLKEGGTGINGIYYQRLVMRGRDEGLKESRGEGVEN